MNQVTVRNYLAQRLEEVGAEITLPSREISICLFWMNC